MPRKADIDRIIAETLESDYPLRLPTEAPPREMRAAEEPSAIRRWLEGFGSEPLDPLGLVRRGDILPGAQQALAAQDLAELQALESQLGEDAPWYAGPLLGGAQGLASLGQTPREALDAFIRGEQDLFVPR